MIASYSAYTIPMNCIAFWTSEAIVFWTGLSILVFLLLSFLVLLHILFHKHHSPSSFFFTKIKNTEEEKMLCYMQCVLSPSPSEWFCQSCRWLAYKTRWCSKVSNYVKSPACLNTHTHTGTFLLFAWQKEKLWFKREVPSHTYSFSLDVYDFMLCVFSRLCCYGSLHGISEGHHGKHRSLPAQSVSHTHKHTFPHSGMTYPNCTTLYTSKHQC